MIFNRECLKEIVKWHIICMDNRLPSRFVPLVIGPSGSGKTYNIRKSINESKRDILFIELDASTMSAEGWKGLNLSSALGTYFDGTEESIFKLENAIVYIDEIDKMAMHGSEGLVGHNKQTQTNLLKWLDKDSTSCYITLEKSYGDKKIPIRTNNMTFIFSGAFEGIYKDMKRSNKGIGFNSGINSIENIEVKWDKVVNFGIIPELVNRMNMLIEIGHYTEQEIINMLMVEPNYLYVRHILGVDIDKNKLAMECLDSGAGARGIAKYVWQEALKESMVKSDD